MRVLLTYSARKLSLNAVFRSAHAACASGITHERCAYLRHRKKMKRKKIQKRAILKLRLAGGVNSIYFLLCRTAWPLQNKS